MIVTSLAALMLAACSGDPNSFFASPAAKAHQRADRAQAAATEQDTTRCASYGFAAGTDAFANCRLELEKARMNAGAAFVGRMQAPAYDFTTPAPAVRCTTIGGAGYSRTECR